MVTAEATLIHGAHQTGEHAYGLHEFGSYHEAERAVDRVRIAGAGSGGVEQMKGRPTTTRAVLLGAGLGGWLGMLTGLVLALSVAGPAWLSVLGGGVLIGAFFGGLVGFLTHWATGGQYGEGGLDLDG